MWLERIWDDFTTPHAGPPGGAVLGAMLILVGLLVLVVGGVLAAVTGGSVLLAVVGGFVLMAAGTVGLAGLPRRPNASAANPVCPRCGAPPGASVTANGFTKCEACGNPYFVF